MSSVYLILLSLTLVSCSTVQNPNLEVGRTPPQSTDAHMHIHPNDDNEDMKFDAARALFAAESIGIQRAIVLSNAYSKMAYKDYARTQNSFVASEVRKNPRKLAGACAINPLMDWAKEEIKKCFHDGLKILKIHTMASGMNLRVESDLRALKDIFSLAAQYRYTVLIHGNFPRATRGNEAEILLKTLKDFPKIRFIIAHLLGKEHELLAGFHHPNFLVEISALNYWAKSQEEKAKLAALMRKVGIKKFLFGSDWPVLHPAEILKALKELPLSESEVEQIVHENAKVLDGLFHN